MRPLPLALLTLLGGCAGNVADYVGPRSGIVAPQLIRYGLDLPQTRCVGERLGIALSPLQLRLFARAAASVKQSWFDPSRLTMRDLLHVAGAMGEPKVRLALAAANQACGVPETIAVHADTPARPPVAPPPEAGTVPPAASTDAPRLVPTAPPRVAAWLNLGSAPTGQSIAIDAATIEQEASTRTAWFRLTNPGGAPPSGIAYRLRIDCAARTIRSLAQRRWDADGAADEYREYGPPENNVLPVEGGTVMEIGWLALCT